MFKATASIVLPTTIIGSLPRPSWYTMNLGNKSFLEAMVNSRFREQYTDALSVYLRDQELAGLDILTDGDCRFDEERHLFAAQSADHASAVSNIWRPAPETRPSRTPHPAISEVSSSPGRMPPMKRSSIGICATTPYRISGSDGGSRSPSDPDAVSNPSENRSR